MYEAGIASDQGMSPCRNQIIFFWRVFVSVLLCYRAL
jgi:hypothetical protein